jgi:hypothetical protein
MSKKTPQSPAPHAALTPSYPAPHDGLIQAIAAVNAVAEKLRRLDTAVDEMPGKLVQAAAAVEDAEQKLAAKEVETLFQEASDTSAEVHALEETAERARTAHTRLLRQEAAFIAMGDGFITEMQAARAVLNTERNVHTIAVHNALADRIVEKTRELADLAAEYSEVAGALGLPGDWLALAHVSDPRNALRLGDSGGTYDRAANILAQGTAAANASRDAALEPLKEARRLIRLREYKPLAQRVKPGN